MGNSKKDEIAKLKKERRGAKAAKKRKENVRNRLVRFLIVCEGTQTEPNYFNKLINDHVSTVRKVDIQGKGMGTTVLVNETKRIKEELEIKNNMSFDRVWVVFDKDDFEDFNNAITTANSWGFQCAWSNEAFELWYCLHFEYLNTGIGRADYITKLQEILRKKMEVPTFEYQKNDSGIYDLLQKYGDEKLAKKHAKRLREQYYSNDYKEHNPCTMVDLLVDELENPAKLL